MHTASYEFLMKPKESAGCHQTLSARVESGDETTRLRLHDKSAICYSAENAHAHESGHVANGHFVLGRDVPFEFDYCLLAIGSKYASNKGMPVV